MKKKPNPKLLVMFDTNVLFTKVESDLVRHRVKEIIKQNSNHVDLSIEWYLPDVVVGERRYQMMSKARELIPSLEKLEKLLGHQFGVGADTLQLHVDKAINIGIEECGFKVAKIQTKDVDWEELISRSVKRKVPFEAAENEKGFRDSIIAHTFIHLLKGSPSTPNICRLAIVSEDQRLRDYVEELTNGSKNVRILASLEELENLINTLASTVTEEFANELAEKANKLFFECENHSTLFYKEKVAERIRKEFARELETCPLPGPHKRTGTWWISKPIFIKKERQRIYWSTTINVDFEAYHYDQSPSTQQTLADLAPSQGISPNWGQTSKPTEPNYWSSCVTEKWSDPAHQPGGDLRKLAEFAIQRRFSTEIVVDYKAKDKFDVLWSTSISQAQNLCTPKIEKIDYMGNDLGEAN